MAQKSMLTPETADVQSENVMLDRCVIQISTLNLSSEMFKGLERLNFTMKGLELKTWAHSVEKNGT